MVNNDYHKAVRELLTIRSHKKNKEFAQISITRIS